MVPRCHCDDELTPCCRAMRAEDPALHGTDEADAGTDEARDGGEVTDGPGE
eukprot:COSAG04_NODE_154_length_22391_cov_6.579760_4_plen_51_part_00